MVSGLELALLGRMNPAASPAAPPAHSGVKLPRHSSRAAVRKNGCCGSKNSKSRQHGTVLCALLQEIGVVALRPQCRRDSQGQHWAPEPLYPPVGISTRPRPVACLRARPYCVACVDPHAHPSRARAAGSGALSPAQCGAQPTGPPSSQCQRVHRVTTPPSVHMESYGRRLTNPNRASRRKCTVHILCLYGNTVHLYDTEQRRAHLLLQNCIQLASLRGFHVESLQCDGVAPTAAGDLSTPVRLT